MIAIISSAIATSVIGGLLLLTFGPRQVVLSRRELEDINDSWELANTSSVPISIVKVKASGSVVDFGRARRIPLKGLNGLRFTLPADEIWFNDWSSDAKTPWRRVQLQPGDVLRVRTPTNSSAAITFRRAGWAGVLDRRTISVHGGI